MCTKRFASTVICVFYGFCPQIPEELLRSRKWHVKTAGKQFFYKDLKRIHGKENQLPQWHKMFANNSRNTSTAVLYISIY